MPDESTPPDAAAPTLTADREKLLFDIWSKAIDTQMHFNEMSTKSRQLGLTFVVSALALAAVMITKDDWLITVGRINIHASPVIMVVSAVAVWFVRVLDLGVYHRMLRGAGAVNEHFEEQYFRPEFLPKLKVGMTQSVSHFSRYDDANKEYTGKKQGSAQTKIEWFYRGIIGVLLAAAVAMFLATKAVPQQKTAPAAGLPAPAPTLHPVPAPRPAPAPLPAPSTTPVLP